MKQRRIIAALLAVMMLLSIPFVGVASATDGDVPPITAVSFSEETIEGALYDYVYLGDYLDFTYEVDGDFSPWNYVVCTVEDKTVAVINEEDASQLHLVGVGTTTLTVTIEGTELTDSVTVTVAEPETINVATGIQMEEDGDTSLTYKLTPAETAEYAIWSERADEEGDPCLAVFDAAGTLLADVDDEHNGLDFKALVELEAGKDYYLNLYHYQDTVYTLNIAKSVEPTGIALEYARYEEYCGFEVYAEAVFQPLNAKEYEIKWSVADETIVTIPNEDDSMGSYEEDADRIDLYTYVYCQKAGTTVLTAATESGLTASATIHVKAPETMEVNTVRHLVSTEKRSMFLYTFTPAESGIYYVACSSQEDYYSGYNISFKEMQGEEEITQWLEANLGDTVNDIDFEGYEMNADTTYSIVVYGDPGANIDLYLYEDLDKLPTCVENEHTADDGTVVLVPTNISAGEKLFTCSVCGVEWIEEIKPVETESSAKVFEDVVEGKWYEDAIDLVYSSGLFKGVSEKTFAINGMMTRGMFVTVLGRLSGIAEDKTATTQFDDVASGKYYTGYVAWAYNAGIVNGVSDTRFAPNNNITREQICKMMVEYCDYADVALDVHRGTGDFTDAASISNWAKDYVASCQKAGLINGIANSDGTYRFNPKGNATRAQVATILMNLAELYL